MSRNVIFVGGPGSGKSNYLFRTWIAIERETGLLVKDGLPPDLGYLHDGATILLDGRFAPHTSRDTRHTSSIPIAQRNLPGFTSTLVVPDASGELWLDLYRKREWPLAWDELITETCGLVLLVLAGSPHNVPALDWVTCERFYRDGVSPQPTDIPTQVLLVDWLQILHSIADRKLGRKCAPRLSVIVTAWDRVPTDRQRGSPQDYLEAEFPLLAQFIQADAHGFCAKVFGLSIVGGDPELDPEFRKHLQLSDPSTLGYVITASSTGVERHADVLEPIYWALGLQA